MHLKDASQPTVHMSFNWGRKPEQLEETPEAPGERAYFVHTVWRQESKPSTPEVLEKHANHKATLLC